MTKLLILGGSVLEGIIVSRAKNLGIYTIVTDSHTDWNLSPAKHNADEAWNISWSDIDTLSEKCRAVGVSGVIAGFSEFRIESMIRLCSVLGLPCSLTLEQLEITRNKILFKNLCRKYDIPCVLEYKYEDKKEYPVIIKPVDRAGSIGINIASNDREFEEYYKVALSLSKSKDVIIEDYITDGVKFDVYYFIIDGKITLLGTSDTIMCNGTNAAPILQKAWVFPSIYERLYKSSTDKKIRSMLIDLGIKDGYITMSAFYNNGQFYFFEAGFRLSGELSFNYYEVISGINYVDLLINYAIGTSQKMELKDLYYHNGHSVILNYFGNSGIINSIDLPDKNDCDSIISSVLYVKDGDIVENATNILKKLAMLTLYSKDVPKLIEDISYINSSIHIWDKDGEDMIYERVNPQNLFNFNDEQIRIMERPYYISLHDIQNLLSKAHKINEHNGLLYATQHQTIEKLNEKLTNSVCMVALKGNNIIGTGTIQYREINHWYHNGKIGLLKLIAVDPAFSNKGIASKIVDSLINNARECNINLIVSDSAEQNIPIRRLYLRKGFNMVDACAYPNNNFYSVVYAKWLAKSPYNIIIQNFMFNFRRILLKLKYKPGKISRFVH